MKRDTVIQSASLLVSISLLGIFAFLGKYGRFFTDDYCYSYSYRVRGLVGTLQGYYYITTFTAHRYALTFFEWVIDRFGVAGIQWMPLVFLILWGAGIFLLLREASRILGDRLTTLETAVLSSVLLLFTIYLAPNRYQSLYWRTGILPYTAPLIAGVWLVFYLLYLRTSNTWIKYGIIGLGAFVGAGFSEAGAVFIAVLFSFVILYCLVASQRGDRQPWESMGKPALLGVAAILAALLIMYLSPVNAQRQASYKPPATVAMTLWGALTFTWDFIWLSVRTQPVPNAVFCLLAAGLAYFGGNKNRISPRRAAWIGAAVLIGTGIVIWAVHLPSAYVEKAPPADRTLILTRFPLLIAEMAVSYLAGGLLRHLPGRTWPALAALAAVAIGWVYIARAGYQIVTEEFPRQAKVAQVWDARDRQVREASQMGAQIVDVQPIDSAYVGGLLELYPTPNWINICAADYYGVKEIHATLDW